MWFSRDQIPEGALTIEQALVETGLAPSLTAARRLIAAGAIHVGDERLNPPADGLVAVAYHQGAPVIGRWSGREP